MLSPYPGGRRDISSSSTLTATPSGSTPAPSTRRIGCSTTWRCFSPARLPHLRLRLPPDAAATPVITKAVIPAAGLGTRFLPATKVLPKEILPVVDRPVIELAVEEAGASGVEHVVLVTNPGKELLLRHFAPAPELERYLAERDKPELLEK